MTEAAKYQTVAVADAEKRIVEARFAGMDKAVALLEKFPTAIDVAVGSLEKLHNEKFVNVGIRFDELNKRLADGDKYKQTALDAALKAAETLVNKQWEYNEKSIRETKELFSKQIESLTKAADLLRDTTKENSGGKRASEELWKSIAIIAALMVSMGTLLLQFFRH
ncbi:MAG: hypothetical protein KGL39_54135 [Patescibacteria group bacterium]|nr:hypothetical protein [Patescibacteria group bacterium]